MSAAARGALPRIAVLGSGRGSNFDAIADAVSRGQLRAQIVAVLSDQGDAPILEKARARGLKALHVGRTQEMNRARHDQEVVQALQAAGAEWAVMAGYMRVVTPVFLDAFQDQAGFKRVVNIHPSILPVFPGLDGYGQAFRHGCKQAGATVHLVELGVDEGPICAQAAFDISSCKSVDEVERLGLAVEHQLYPQTLDWVLNREFVTEMSKERLSVRKS